MVFPKYNSDRKGLRGAVTDEIQAKTRIRFTGTGLKNHVIQDAEYDGNLYECDGIWNWLLILFA